MPTGYTSKLYDGKDETFEDFVLSCARGMGAFIMQRDDSPNDKPKLRTVSDYYIKGVAKAEADLARWNNMPDDVKYDEWRDYADATEKRAAERRASDEELRSRYNARLLEVRNWQVPPVLESFKQFMIDQIQSSIEFDCLDEKYLAVSVKDFDEWCELQQDHYERDVVYYNEQLDKEVQRVKEQNVYTFALYNALGLEP